MRIETTAVTMTYLFTVGITLFRFLSLDGSSAETRSRLYAYGGYILNMVWARYLKPKVAIMPTRLL